MNFNHFSKNYFNKIKYCFGSLLFPIIFNNNNNNINNNNNNKNAIESFAFNL
jgi:hypothetical protein